MKAKGHPSKPKQWSPFAPDATALNHVQSTLACASGYRVRQKNKGLPSLLGSFFLEEG
jgi:hypothetical protein